MNTARKSAANAAIALAGALLCALAAGAATRLRAQESPARTAPAPASIEGGIAAIVGSDVITYGELDRKIEEHLKSLGSAPNPALSDGDRNRLRHQFLEFLIQRQLLLQEAKRREITATETEIDYYVERKIEEWRRRDIDVRDDEDFYQMLQENQGIGREAYREEIRKAVLMEKLLWTYVFTSQEFITPGERREYYRTHIEEFQTPSEMTFRQIYLSPTEDALPIMDVIDRALDKGIAFAELARNFSESFREEGGLWVKKFDEILGWPAPLPETLRGMKPGQVARRVRTVRGFHYLLMESITPGAVQPFSEVQENIEDRLRQQRRESKRQVFLSELRVKFGVKLLLAALDKPKPAPAPRAAPEEGEGAIKDVSPEPAPAVKPAEKKDGAPAESATPPAVKERSE